MYGTLSRWLSRGRLQPRLKGRQFERKSSTSVEAQGPEPPNGFLFNEKPLLPGEKRVKESWENRWVFGMSFNFLLALVIVLFKPDTSVITWGRKRALQQLAEEEGEETATEE